MNAVAIAMLCCGALIETVATGPVNYVPINNPLSGPACLAMGDTYSLEVRGQTDIDGRLLSGVATGFINGELDGSSTHIAFEPNFPPTPGEFGVIDIQYDRHDYAGTVYAGFPNASFLQWGWRADDSELCGAHVSPMTWVTVSEYFEGDANLDGTFDSTDLIKVFVAGQYDDGVRKNSTWETGDWTGDQEFDSDDLVVGMIRGYRAYPAATAVPEPSAIVLLCVGLGLLLTAHRHPLRDAAV